MSSGRPRILLVDDDRSVLAGVSGLLRDEGYRTAEVETVAGGAAAARGTSATRRTSCCSTSASPSRAVSICCAAMPQPLPGARRRALRRSLDQRHRRGAQLGATDFVEKPPSLPSDC